MLEAISTTAQRPEHGFPAQIIQRKSGVQRNLQLPMRSPLAYYSNKAAQQCLEGKVDLVLELDAQS